LLRERVSIPKAAAACAPAGAETFDEKSPNTELARVCSGRWRRCAWARHQPNARPARGFQVGARRNRAARALTLP